MSATQHSNEVSQAILNAVAQLQQGTGFGSIEIILHEGRVTQIEKREKLRFSHEKSDRQRNETSTTLHAINSVATKK
jgi:hypothetical protein